MITVATVPRTVSNAREFYNCLVRNWFSLRAADQRSNKVEDNTGLREEAPPPPPHPECPKFVRQCRTARRRCCALQVPAVPWLGDRRTALNQQIGYLTIGRDVARRSARISRINRARTWPRDETNGGVIVGIFPSWHSPSFAFLCISLSLSLSLSLCLLGVAFRFYSLLFP